ncbi:MAG: transcription elongation factor GreA [Tissierellia bacterium]|nr:transcription elongation factor GreA [Tissierellia bacterium]
MVEKQVFMTQEGYNKIEEELEELKSVKRKEISDRIKQALEFGDISENSEYDQAKSDQAQLEERIIKLEGMLRDSAIIEEESLSTTEVSIGSTVKLKAENTGETMEIMIVGSAEADPFENKISNESPMGNAILGLKRNQVAIVPAPGGDIKYKILKISK